MLCVCFFFLSSEAWGLWRPPLRLLLTYCVHIDNCGLDDEVEVVAAAAFASVLAASRLKSLERRRESSLVVDVVAIGHTHTEQRKKRTELTHIQYTHTVCVCTSPCVCIVCRKQLCSTRAL